MYNYENDSDLGHAAAYIGKILARYGRIRVAQTKVKFGSIRVYMSFGWDSLLTLTHPRWSHYGPYPEWLKNFDIMYISKALPWTNPVVIPYQRWIYRLAYKAALKRWPNLQDEIIDSADYSELLQDLKGKI